MSFATLVPSALKASPPSDPPRLRIGLGGDIPVFPPLAMALLIAGGFVASFVTGTRASVFGPLTTVPEEYRVPLRVAAAFGLALFGIRIKKQCDQALEVAGTKAYFVPVPSIADTGPYATCRNPMYCALLFLPCAVGAAADTGWVMLGSSACLWWYLHFVVVPAEEQFLSKELGDVYKKYCASVKRWGFM